MADTRLDGVFSGNANVRWFADGSQPVVDASLKGNGVKVVQNLDGTNLPVAFDTLTMTTAMKNGKLNLQWLIAIAGNGKINGNVQISDLEKRRQLSGNVGIDNISLDLLKPLLGKGDKATGRLNAGCVWAVMLHHRCCLASWDYQISPSAVVCCRLISQPAD